MPFPLMIYKLTRAKSKNGPQWAPVSHLEKGRSEASELCQTPEPLQQVTTG